MYLNYKVNTCMYYFSKKFTIFFSLSIHAIRSGNIASWLDLQSSVKRRIFTVIVSFTLKRWAIAQEGSNPHLLNASVQTFLSEFPFLLVVGSVSVNIAFPNSN